MSENLLTGSSIASFKGIELHRYLVSFTDSRGPRVVEHTFPKRDSAKQEVMGRRPHGTEWQLVFTGPKWIDTLKQLVATIDADPSGLLVHPIYGQMQVVCQGFDRASVNLPEATDTVPLPLVFVEDDQALDDAGLSQGVGAQQQNVISAVADFQAMAAPYTAPASVAGSASLASAANDYALTAAASAQGTVIPRSRTSSAPSPSPRSR